MTHPASPIIVKRRKAGHKGGHGGSAWKVAYADFVTAMMAFFMLLWLISAADEDLKKGLADYFSLATEPAPAPSSAKQERPGVGSQQRTVAPAVALPIGRTMDGEGRMGGLALVPSAALVAQADELRLALEREPEIARRADAVRLRVETTGIRIELHDRGDRPMFAAGSAAPSADAAALLGGIARQLGATGARLVVTGHTDAAGGQGEANWLLSAARGQAARRVLTAAGLPVARIAEVTGVAADRPANPAGPGRAENRRVTLLVLAETSPLPLELGLTR